MADTNYPSEQSTQRRDDILISICFADLEENDKEFAQIRSLAKKINEHFRFWEFIVIVNTDEIDSYFSLVNDTPNVRLFKVWNNSEYYHNRIIAAREAIGDVVVISSIKELRYIDILKIIDRAHSENKIIQGKKSKISLIDRCLSPLITTLGTGAGFNVSMHDLQTIAVPRTLMNQILNHPYRELALRFPPNDPHFPLSYENSKGSNNPNRRMFANRDRLGLLLKLLTNLAPRILLYVILLSAMVTVTSLAYSIYSIIAWFVLTDIEPGWLTLSLITSLTSFFLGCAIFGISLGIENLLSRFEKSNYEDIAGEVNKIDLFGQIENDLNIEIHKTQKRSSSIRKGDK